MTSSRFADQFWATAPLLTRGEELRQGFGDLFSLEAADEILSTRGLRTPFIRVAKDGAIIDTARFTGPGGVGATVADQVVDDRIMELFASGHTVVLQALHRFWPPLVEFAGALSEDLAHPVQINAYITPRQSQGFSAHYDVHDVFVLQIAGSKRWIIHDPVHPDPLPSQPWTRYRRAVESRAAEDPRADDVLGEGDVLYLPRGFIHSAEALGGVSVHLTIGIHSHTRHDLVRSLLELAEEDPRLRRSLPLGVDIGDPAQLSSDLAATVTALTEQIQAVPVSEIAPVMARRARGSTRPAPVGPLAQAQALERLSSDTLVSVRSRQPVTIRNSGERVVLEHPGGSVTFAAAAGDALTALLVGRSDPGRRASRAGRRGAARARRAADARRHRGCRRAGSRIRALMGAPSAAGRLRCSYAADERGDPLAGTAAHANGFLLIEAPGAWGQNALSESRLDPEIANVVAARAAEVSYRVLLIKRPGRAAVEPRRAWVVVDSTPGAERTTWGSYASDRELLDIPLDTPADGEAT